MGVAAVGPRVARPPWNWAMSASAQSVAALLDLPAVLLAHVLKFMSSERDLLDALSTCTALHALGAAEPAIFMPLASRYTWCVRRREAESCAELFRRVHTGAASHHLLAVGGDAPDQEWEGLQDTGGDPDELARAVQAFDPSLEEWSGAPSTASVRNASAAASDGSTAFVVGGWDVDDDDDEDPNYQTLRSVEVLEPYGPVEEMEWQTVKEHALPQGRCFAAAACDGASRLWLAGGGDSPSRGATCFRSVLCCAAPWEPAPCVDGDAEDEDGDEAPATPWKEAGQLLRPRCGLALAADARRSELIAVGGYSGGDVYENSAESFDMETGRSFALPDMRTPRSGAGVGMGPDGCVYVCGGSPDGSGVLSAVERLDPREGTWKLLPPMPTARGYLAAEFGMGTGHLYAAGGSSATGQPLDAFECFDRAANQWRALPPMPSARANLALLSVMEDAMHLVPGEGSKGRYFGYSAPH